MLNYGCPEGHVPMSLTKRHIFQDCVGKIYKALGPLQGGEEGRTEISRRRAVTLEVLYSQRQYLKLICYSANGKDKCVDMNST